MTRPAGRELEIGSSPRKTARPSARGLSPARRAPRDPAPGILDRLVDRLAGDRPLAGALSRYFMSQICCEIEATIAMSAPSRMSEGRLCQQPRQSASSAFVRRPFGSADVPGEITRPVASPSCPAQGKQNPAGQVFRLRRLHAEARSKRQIGARKKRGLVTDAPLATSI